MPKLDRREFLVGSTLAAPWVSTSRTQSGRPPNVVLILTDDQGYGDLSCHGNPYIHTTHFDALHGDSVRFTNFHVSPICAPTRGALLTGRYTDRLGCWRTTNHRNLMFRDEVTMAGVFAENGYRTGLFGKWHLGDTYPYRPIDRGFQEAWTFSGGGVGTTPDYWDNHCFDDTYAHNGRYQKVPGYDTDVFFSKAIDFIGRSRRHPFFCHIPTRSPHGPYMVPEKYTHARSATRTSVRITTACWRNLDENLGKLMQQLRELDLANNTILMFLSDNGATSWKRRNIFNAGMRGLKGTVYEGGHRVPCFLRWPAELKGGRDIPRLAAHIDVLPTLAQMCGLKCRTKPLDGLSLAPLLRGEASSWPSRTLFVDVQHTLALKQGNYAVMTDRWRLINGRELYDLEADPAERANVAAEHPRIAAQLRGSYEKWWTEVSGRSAELCPLVIGSGQEDPYKLTCYDWPDPGPPAGWHQREIRAGIRRNGYWPIEVARDGFYEFELRRWPRELDRAFDQGVPELNPETDYAAASPAGVPIAASRARLKIAEFDQTQTVAAATKAVRFRTALKAGQLRLDTWIYEEDGSSRGAYYVYVTRLQ